jgi:peptidyl-prolyl cis-trans isomerase A (cyclophilin A)
LAPSLGMSHILLMNRILTLLAFAGAAVLSTACTEKSAPPPPAKTAVATPPADSFRVTFETSRGPIVVAVQRSWAPKGADRFRELVQAGFFDDDRFFRVVPGFVAQFGINDKPKVNDEWDGKRIVDDSVKQSNRRGTIVFATQGPNTRTHQLFINLADNERLDRMGFAPIGRVVQGMAVVDSLYSGYGDSPDQQFIQTIGNSYLTRTFPKLDYIKTAKITEY